VKGNVRTWHFTAGSGSLFPRADKPEKYAAGMGMHQENAGLVQSGPESTHLQRRRGDGFWNSVICAPGVPETERPHFHSTFETRYDKK
jgi:hypothetical protein